MRTVSTNVSNAIAANTRQMTVRATFQQMRTYFTALNYNNPPTVGLENPTLPEDSNNYPVHPGNMTFVNPNMYTVFADGQKLRGMIHNSTTANIITYSGGSIHTDSRIGINASKIFWKDRNTGTIYEGDMTWGTWTVSTRTQVVALGSGYANMSNTIHALSSTLLVFVYIKSGGFGVKIYHNSAGWHEEASWDNAMMFPKTILTLNSPAVFYTAAVNVGNSPSYPTIIYFTSPEDGCVWAVKYDPATGKWSDAWIALQSDLSDFRCMNAFYYGGKVLLLGQFARNGDEIKHNPVSMLLTSEDGKFMSIDQYALISKMGWRFYGTISSNSLYLSDTNRVMSRTLGAAHFNISASNTVTTAVEKFTANSGINGADANIILKADDEILINDANVDRLNRCLIEIGYNVFPGTLEYTVYDYYIVDQLNVIYADGVRVLDIKMVQEAFWRLNTQTPPYYTEVIGKSGLLDTLKDYGNMYVSSGSSTMETHFSMDFWNAEKWTKDSSHDAIDILYNGGVAQYTHTTGTAQCFRSADIIDHLACIDYPELTQQAVTVNIYGWARGKVGSTGLNVAKVVLGVILERAGEEEYHPCTLSGLSARWHKTYPDTITGVSPITYVIGEDTNGLGIQIGDKIKRFVIMFEDDSTPGDCLLCIERVEIASGIKIGYEEGGWQSMPIVEPSASTAGGYKLPGYGRHIMLSSKPYSAFGSITSATFERNLGSAPTSSGNSRSGFGLVILAEDGNNCIICRYQTYSSTDGLSNRIRIIKVRNGQETELAVSSGTYDYNLMRMFVIHKGNTIDVYVGSTESVLRTKAVSYTWVASQGAMATATEESLHVGIYMEKSPAHFRCASFDIRKSSNIPVLIGEDLASTFDTFGASGKVAIEDRVYNYASKSPNTYFRGPFRYLTSYATGAYESGGRSYPAGNYYDINFFYWRDNATYYNVYDGYLISSNSGVSRQITNSDWKPPLNFAWDNGPGPRSFHTDSPSEASLETMDGSTKMYIGPGLRGVTKADGQESTSHGPGTYVYLYATEDYKCLNFAGFSGNNEMTVKDIINIISKSCGVVTTFSGDYVDDVDLMAATPFQIY